MCSDPSPRRISATPRSRSMKPSPRAPRPAGLRYFSSQALKPRRRRDGNTWGIRAQSRMDVDAPAIAALDLLPEPTLFVDLDGIILSANLACGRHLQQSRDSLARTPLAAIAAEEAGSLHHYLRECARSGQLHMGSLTLRRRDGVTVKFRAGGALSHRSNASPQSRVVLLRLVPAPESGIAFIALNEKIRQLNAENARR